MLKLKHWQIFLILVVGLFVNNFTIQNDQTLTTLLTVTGSIIYFLWGFVVGHKLYQLAPRKVNLNYNLFLINSFAWMIAYIVVIIISEGKGMMFSGVAALPGFYVFYAFLHYLMFPVRVLRSIEQNKKARIGECIGDFFLNAFLPIGIWFLQPRINKVATTQRELNKS